MTYSGFISLGLMTETNNAWFDRFNLMHELISSNTSCNTISLVLATLYVNFLVLFLTLNIFGIDFKAKSS